MRRLDWFWQALCMLSQCFQNLLYGTRGVIQRAVGAMNLESSNSAAGFLDIDMSQVRGSRHRTRFSVQGGAALDTSSACLRAAFA